MPRDLERRGRLTAVVLWLAGVVAGVMLAAGPAAAAEGGADWPNWRGPYSNGSVDDWPGGVVDHPDQARLLWTSEEQNLPGSGGPRWDGGRLPAGGYSDVIVVNGRVYLNYHWPSPQHQDKEFFEFLQAKGETRFLNPGDKDKSFMYGAMPLADDIVICLDAATGKTLWKTVFPASGLNVNHTNHRYKCNYFDIANPHLVPCYRDGRVMTIGSSGRIYAMDARSGKPLWETDLGYSHLQAAQWLEYVRGNAYKGAGVNAPPSCNYSRQAFDSSPTVADGVLLCHDSKIGPSRQSGMRGFDTETGRQLWEVPKCLPFMAGYPVRWIYRGKEYAIAAGPTKTMCVEPKTGRTLWELTGQPHLYSAPPVGGGHLFLNGMGDERFTGPKDVSGACYRITPEKAELLWRLPFSLVSSASPVVYSGWICAARQPNQCAVRLETGETVKINLGPVYGPCAGDGFIFGGRSDGDAGRIFKISPDGKTFEDVSPKTNAKLFSHSGFLSPVYVAGRMYLRTPNSIRCIDFRKDATPPKADPLPPKATDAAGWVRQLSSPYFSYREEALAALIAMGPERLPAQLPALVRLLAGEDWQGRSYAARAVRALGAAAKPASAEIKQAWWVAVERKAAGDVELLSKALVLADPSQAKEVTATLAKLTESSEFRDVALGCQALGELEADGKDGVSALVLVCKSEDVEKVQCAVRALGVIGPAAEAAAPVLGELLQHKDQEVIFQTTRTLWRMDASAKGAFPAVLKARDYSVGEYYLPVATAAMGADIVVPALCEELAKEAQTKTSRDKKVVVSDRLRYLLGSLQYCGPSAKPALPTLTALLRDWPDGNPSFREYNNPIGFESLLRILENLGPDAKAVGPELEKWCKKNQVWKPRFATVMKKIGVEPAP